MTNEVQQAPFFKFRCEQYGPDGQLKSITEGRNTVMIVGKNLLNNTLFQQGTGSSIYIGLMGTGTIGNTDNVGTHSGWVETTAYTGTARQTLTAGAAVGGTSTFAPGTFAMTGTYTANGAFIATQNTAGGTTGTMYSAGTFATVRTGGTGDTLVVTPTLVTA